jgi:CDP-diacylglycerol--glycerol-3-phosphate 3-phosphatidyltransferase/cardiolipin synthase
MSFTIPNLLTLLRIALIPVLFIVFWLPFEWAKPVSAIMFTIAALTDWFDGYLARRLEQYSSFGEFLDPVADKLMVVAALILILSSKPEIWMAIPIVIIIGREIVISALREWMAEIGKRAAVNVSMLGKVKTTFQMFAIAFLLYEQPLFGLHIYWLGFVLLQIAAVLTVLSMLIYLKAAWPYIADTK